MWTFILHRKITKCILGHTNFFIFKFKNHKSIRLNIIFEFSFVFKYFKPMVGQEMLNFEC